MCNKLEEVMVLVAMRRYRECCRSNYIGTSGFKYNLPITWRRAMYVKIS
jgi:hypothetical protein